MRILHQRSVRLGLLLVICAFCVLNIRSQYLKSQSLPPPRYVPPTGLMDNDTGGAVPGNPQNGIDDLKEIYAAISVFRNRHRGEYPTNANTVIEDILKDPKSYGFADFKEGLNCFLNPDNLYSDDPFAKKHADSYVKYHLSDKRVDGSMIGTNKAAQEKDVLASTDAYYHQNIRIFPKGRSTGNPVGFYLVLWDDGTIQRIPYDKVMYAPKGDGDFIKAFAGQAGVPSNALSYDEFYRLAGWKKGPRGSVGGKGMTFSGRPYR